ncbi:hypothetical protein [Streptomyces sp. SID4982]|uniref:hypothetical protein n=1 Tax=Streptomyces sp. SID4982 TaxID=2690291 RepID=UPI00136FBB5F|nr:hypothetical protein [Streptomyces sp. SID4982]MYS15076.1 hypothetical protein [Streptomyces sp. SID4982]
MNLTNGARNTTAVGATTALGGSGLIFYGIDIASTPHTLGGSFLALVGLSAIALTHIHRWVTNTADERRSLAAAQREAQDRKDRYLAGLAALEGEQSRISREMAAERASLVARLKTERDALAAEFEEQRAELVSETVEATFMMIHGGKFATTRQPGNLIQFPKQQDERARAREHGGVAP